MTQARIRRVGSWGWPEEQDVENTAKWMLYGAYGYTGRLIVAEALERGHQPVLAGRNASKLESLARETKLPSVTCSLDDPQSLERAVAGCQLVLHVAGPFVETCEPMLRACLRKGVSYLDITGELPVFERTLAVHEEALARGILVTSGVGFDVVPGDCLAAYVAEQVRDPVELEIAYSSMGQASAGTIKSALGIVRQGGCVLREGGLKSQALGRGSRELHMWQGTSGGKMRRMRGIPAPLGDLLTASRTTNIGNVTAYVTLPPGQARGMAWLGPLLPKLLNLPGVLESLSKRVDHIGLSPRNQRRSLVWARVRNGRGGSAEAWLDILDGYSFTAKSAVRAVETYFAQRPSGALTPALAFGSDFVLDVPTTLRHVGDTA